MLWMPTGPCAPSANCPGQLPTPRTYPPSHVTSASTGAAHGTELKAGQVDAWVNG